MLKNKIIKIIQLIISIVITLTPFVIFPVCAGVLPNGTHMKCYHSGMFVTALGAFVTILLIINLFTKKKVYSYILNFIVIIATSLMYMVPHQVIKLGDKMKLGWEVGFCRMAMKNGKVMTCFTQTKPALNILIPTMILVSIIAIILVFLGDDNATT